MGSPAEKYIPRSVSVSVECDADVSLDDLVYAMTDEQFTKFAQMRRDASKGANEGKGRFPRVLGRPNGLVECAAVAVEKIERALGPDNTADESIEMFDARRAIHDLREALR